MAPLSNIARGVLCAVAAFASFATGDAIVKFVSGGLSLAQIVFVSSVGALVPVVIVGLRHGGPRSLVPKDWVRVGLRMVLLAGDVFMAYYAFTRLPLANAYTMILTTPLIVTALAGPMLGEYPGWRRWSAVVVGFVGVLIVLRPGMVALDPGYLGGFGSSCAFAIAMMLTRRLGSTETGTCLVFTAFLGRALSAGVLLPFFWMPMSLSSLGLLLAVGLFAGLGHTFVWLAFRSAPASVVSPFQFSQIVWGTLYGLLLFGDVPDRYVVIGSLTIVGSGLYVFFREQKVKAAQT